MIVNCINMDPIDQTLITAGWDAKVNFWVSFLFIKIKFLLQLYIDQNTLYMDFCLTLAFSIYYW